jgi:hypothetical protein
MILESAQMLSTVCRNHGIDTKYLPTHAKHPCTLWAGESLENWLWLKQLAKCLNVEYIYRYSKAFNHRSWDVIVSLPVPPLPSKGLTPFALAMPDEYKQACPVASYRAYYMREKQHIAVWTRRAAPHWYNIQEN